MKKIIKTLLVVMVVVLALTAFVACQQEEPAPEIPACEHTGGTATCSKQAICELCGELYGEKAAHTPVEIPEVKPTCMNIGFTSGTKCEACGLVLEAQQKVEKSGHNMVDVEAKAPTCGEEGYVAHKKCSACGIVDESYATVEPTGEHTFTIDVEAKTPTCLEDGYTAHKTCELCGNPNEDYVLYTAGDDYHSFPEEDQFFVTPPTCTTTGVLAGYCEYCGKGYYLDKNYPALGHKDEDANGVCDVCEENMPAEEPECEHVWNEGEVTTAPTCEAAGVKTYTCTVEGCGETKTEEVAALDHAWADATCTAPKTCETCGATEGEALGHDIVVDTAVDATCTTTGLTAGEHCSRCDHKVEQEEVPALGHDYDHITHDATCTAAGYVEHICAVCDDTYTDGETEALGHADENGDFKCDRCSTTMLPADGTALTVEQALAVAQLGGSSYTTQKYYITGIVTGLYNTQYGNFYIKNPETGKEICIYGLYTWNKAVRYDAMDYKPVNGDEVTVYTVLGTYNGTAQGKDAWLDEVVAHEHDYKSVVTDPGCLTEGYTTDTCSICSASNVHSTVEALGHTTDNGECERCGQTIGGDAPVVGTLAEFTFGANGSATHKDPSSKFSNGKSYTVNGYALTFTSATNCYDGGNDAMGNSCMKMGTSSAVGSFTVTVPDNVTEVVIYVAQYKANTTKISVNGGAAQTITTASNNGAYTAITIDTSVNKTFTFATVSGAVRCMIDTIVFNGTAN